MAALARTLPFCANHGDTHIGNQYIDVDGEPGFFDSLPHLAPAMYEVSYHVTGALDVAVTKAGADTLLGRVQELILEAERTRPPNSL